MYFETKRWFGGERVENLLMEAIQPWVPLKDSETYIGKEETEKCKWN